MHIVERLENFCVPGDVQRLGTSRWKSQCMIILNMRSEYECWFYVQILWVAGVWWFISSLDDGLGLLRSQISSQKKPKDKSK